MTDLSAAKCSALLIRARLAGCKGFLVTDPANVRYLSGFPGEDSWLLVAPRERLLITDSRFAEEAEKSCPSWTPHLRTGSIALAAADLIKSLAAPVAFEARHLTMAAKDALAKGLKRRKALVPTEGIVEALRITKAPSEIAAIRRAVTAAEKGFYEALDVAPQNSSENDFAALVEFCQRRHGAEAAAFPTIAAAEPSSSLPHARPSSARAFDSATLLVDWGARVDGYNSDLTRLVASGKVGPRISRIWRVVKAAHKAALHALRPGVAASSVDRAARKVIADAGYGEFFGHGVGHGVGLEVHEGPSLSPSSRLKLRVGMVVTIEPGIYLPGVGGVRLEDMALVTAAGARLLTHAARAPRTLGKRVSLS